MIWDDAIGPVREVHAWTDRPSNGLFNEYWPQGVGRPTDSPRRAARRWTGTCGSARRRSGPTIRLRAVSLARLVGFRHRRAGRHRLPFARPGVPRLKLGHPESVEASSTRVNTETYPLASMVTYHFPARGEMPPLKLVWYDGGLRPPRPEELERRPRNGRNGHLIVGDQGKILSARAADRPGLFSDSWFRAREYGDPPQKLPRSIGHYKEWIEACKGGTPGGSNFDWAGPLTEAVLLGNIALRPELREELTTKTLEWDSTNLRFTNSETANQFVKREYRNGWSV